MTSGWLHIARRDLRAAATAPLLWLVLATWIGVVHAAFALTLWRMHGSPIPAGVPLYAGALGTGGFMLMLFAPALTMNAWAAERAQGTWQMLMSMPLHEADLVLGKFLAAWALLLLLLLATLGMPTVLAVISAVPTAHMLSCYLGLALLAAFLAALGTWFGLLVEGPVAAYMLTFASAAVLWLAGIGGDQGPLGPVAAAIGLGERVSPFLAGRVGLAEVVWLLGGTCFFLLLAHGAMRSQRLGGGHAWWRRIGIAGMPVLAAGVLLGVGSAAATRSGLAVDLSADHRFTLAPALLRQIDNHAGRLSLHGIWDDDEDAALRPVADLCARLAQTAARVDWQRIDPLRQRPAMEELRARHGELNPPALWIEAGDRGLRIPLHYGSRRTLQRDIAGAVATLDDPMPPTVRLLQGHGELRPTGDGDDACAQVLGMLHAAGLRTAVLDDAAPPPPAGDVLAVLGPTAALGTVAIGRLDDHLRDGGGVLVLADDRAPADLGLWLRRRGVVWSGAVPLALEHDGNLRSLLDPTAPCQPPRHLVSLANYRAGHERDLPNHNLLLRGDDRINGGHPVTAPVAAAGMQVLSPYTAACDVLPPNLGAEIGIAVGTSTILLRTAPGDVWLRQRSEPLQVPVGIEQAEARPIAWAMVCPPAADAAATDQRARVVIWGSRQAASDTAVGQAGLANGLLLSDACRWLARRDAPPDVPPAEVAAYQIAVSDNGLHLILGGLCVVLPALCIGVALLNWIDRRR